MIIFHLVLYISNQIQPDSMKRALQIRSSTFSCSGGRIVLPRLCNTSPWLGYISADCVPPIVRELLSYTYPLSTFQLLQTSLIPSQMASATTPRVSDPSCHQPLSIHTNRFPIWGRHLRSNQTQTNDGPCWVRTLCFQRCHWKSERVRLVYICESLGRSFIISTGGNQWHLAPR